MSDSKYPNQLDTDVEIQHLYDNLSELGTDVINSLRSAVFAIEETLGLNPQGTMESVSERLDVSLNKDGTIKASALSTVGLVTLPITNDMIASNAAIEESKLNLDYATAVLETEIETLNVLLTAVQNSLTLLSNNFSKHVLHPSELPYRHYTSDIDGYSGSTFENLNLEGVLDYLKNEIDEHISDVTDAHDASAISFDDTGLPIDANNVQEGLSNAALYIEGSVKNHRTKNHSNGILKFQDVTFGDTNRSYVLINSASATVPASTYKSITFTVSLSSVSRNDIIDISLNGTVYTKIVDYVDYTNKIIYFSSPLPTSGSCTATIYKKSDEETAPASLNVVIKKSSGDGVSGPVVQLIHPKSPYILSSNSIDPRVMNSTQAKIKLSWATGSTNDINIFSLMQSFDADPSAWTIENVAKVLNSTFSDSSNYLPLLAFTYGGRLGLVYDNPDGYLQIKDPTEYSAWSALGFVAEDISYSLNRKFYIDGYEFSDIRKQLDIDCVYDASYITVSGIDLKTLGLIPGSSVIARLSDSYSGTYSGTVSSASQIWLDSTPYTSMANHVVIYSDYFSMPSLLTAKTQYDLLIDAYDYIKPIFIGMKRAEFGTSGAVSNYFEIIDVSRNFPSGQTSVIYNPTTKSIRIVNGEEINLPTPSASVIGYKFRLFNSDMEYLDFEVIADYTVLTDTTLDITIFEKPSEKRYLQVGKVLHNKTSLRLLEDRRLFGNVGRYDLRSDAVRDYTSYPTSLLFKNGVTRGCEITASVGGADVSFLGGQALVNGNIYNIAQKNLQIPQNVGVAADFNLYVDANGAIRLEKDNSTDSLNITPSTKEIIESQDKLILYTFSTLDGSLISSITDLRKFVGLENNKVDLYVQSFDDNSEINYGSFSSLKTAVNYLNTLNNNTVSRRIKIKGEINHNLSTDGYIVLPESTILEGDGNGKYIGSYSSQIILSGTSATNQFIVPSRGCIIKGLNITLSTGTNLKYVIGNNSDTGIIRDAIIEDGYFVIEDNQSSSNVICIGTAVLTGDSINNTTINNCTFEYKNSANPSNNFAINAGSGNITDSIISNCKFIFPTISSLTNFAINGTYINNSKIIGNNLSCGAITSVGTYGIYCSTLVNSYILENTFDKINNSITCSGLICLRSAIKDNIISNTSVNQFCINVSYANSFTFENNIFNNCAGGAIYLSGSGNNITLNNNIYLETENISNYDTSVFKIFNFSNCILDNNIIVIDGQFNANAAISFTTTVERRHLKITNNSFINYYSGTSWFGFDHCIDFNTSNPGKWYGVLIDQNFFYNYRRNITSAIIKFTNFADMIKEIIVSDNISDGGSIFVYGKPQAANILNNIVYGYMGSVLIDLVGGDISILNNKLYAGVTSSYVISIIEAYALSINNNHITANTSNTMVRVWEGTGTANIIGNTFDNDGTFGASNAYAIDYAGTDTDARPLIAFNNLNKAQNTDNTSLIYCPYGGTDILNKGQTYFISFPLESAKSDTLYSSTTGSPDPGDVLRTHINTWGFVVSDSSDYYLYSAANIQSGVVLPTYLSFNFNSSIIPPGATVEKPFIRYKSASASATAISTYCYCKEYNGSIVGLGTDALAGTSNVLTNGRIFLNGDSFIVQPGFNYFIVIKVNENLVSTIYGFGIEYTL